MADQNFIDGLKTELEKLNDPELTALRQDVEALKGKSPKASIVETWKSTDGAMWYRLWSDGWIEQGGVKVNIAGLENIVFQYPKPFKDLNHSVQLGVAVESSNYISWWSLGRRKTPTSYTWVSGGDTCTYSIYACGY